MRRAALTAAALVAVAATAPMASADDPCKAEGGVYEKIGYGGAVITIGQGKAGDGTIYIDDRDATGNGIWIYIESNDQDGLQRGNGTALLGADLGGTDECRESDFPDGYVIF